MTVLTLTVYEKAVKLPARLQYSYNIDNIQYSYNIDNAIAKDAIKDGVNYILK